MAQPWKSTVTYDPLNRLTALSAGTASYSYQLGPTGNRTQATEGNGRTLQWSYDGIYRLTNEQIASDPNNVNGSVAYGLDPVGNRLTETSSLNGVNSGSFGYNADDEVSTETYDNNGNTLTTGGKTFTYDAENHLTGMSGGGTTVSIVYDAFGNRVAKTVNGVTTQYLVEDDVNPTGYPQVMEEIAGTTVQRVYAYGLQRISEDQVVNNAWTPSFYGYDGAGSVRQLTNAAGAVTDTYEYDAFGNKINSTGTTPNNYLYRGEQYDSDLSLYYLRARYYNPATGRFMSRDPESGKLYDQATFHKYLYAGGNPVNRIDPQGLADLVETGLVLGKATLSTELVAGAIGCGASLGFTISSAMLSQDFSFGFANPDGSFSGAGTAGNTATITGCLTTMFSRIPTAKVLGVAAGWVGCIASVVQVIQDIQQIEKDTDPTAVANDGAKAETDLISGDFGCALTIAAAVGAF